VDDWENGFGGFGNGVGGEKVGKFGVIIAHCEGFSF